MPLMEIKPCCNKRDLARLLGCRRGTNFSPALNAKVRFWINRLNSIMKSRLLYEIHNVRTVSNETVYLEGNRGLNSMKLSRTIKGSREIVCFVATIGDQIDHEISRLLNKKRISDAYVLDALGSVTVENIVEQFQESMRKDYKTQEKALSLRFSPGYCDWPLTEQKKIFQLLDSKIIGVELTDVCLMQPRKSISGIFGIFHFEDGKDLTAYNPCFDCKKTDCMDKRIYNRL